MNNSQSITTSAYSTNIVEDLVLIDQTRQSLEADPLRSALVTKYVLPPIQPEIHPWLTKTKQKTLKTIQNELTLKNFRALHERLLLLDNTITLLNTSRKKLLLKKFVYEEMISAYRIQTISDAACIKDLVIENTELKASIKKAVTPTEDSSEQGDIIDFNSPDPYIHTMPEALPDFHEQSRYSESFAELVVQKNLPKKTTSDKNDALKEMKIIDDWCDEAQSEHFTANLLYQETPIGSLTSDQIPIVTSTISGHKTLTDISKLPKLSCNGTQQENDIEISLFESAIARMKEIDGEFLSEHRIRSIILGLFKSNSKVYGWWFDNILPTIIKDQLKSADSIIDRIRKSFGDPSRSDNAFSALQILTPFDGSHESTDSYWKEFARLRRIALPNHDHDIQTQFPDYAAIKVFIKGCPPSISITFVQHVTSERKFIAIQYRQSRQTPNVPEEFILDAFLIWLKGKITLFKIDPVANIYNPLKAYTSTTH
jgi:hypothetical protein